MGVAKVRYPPLDPVVDRVGVKVESGGAPREPVADARGRPLDRVEVDIVEHDLPAGFERDLGDSRTHHAGADDPDGCHTAFSASNGWRHPRQ